MPQDEQFIQKKNDQLTKEIRVTSDYHASKLKQKDRTLYNQKTLKEDIRDIDTVLKGELTDQERARLEMVRGRNLSSLLVLSEKTTGDSKQMKKVKMSVTEVEKEINKSRREDRFTEKDIDDILGLYRNAILACKDYMGDKTPSYGKGEDRYALVRMNMIRLHEEAEAFLAAKELIRAGKMDAETRIARDLMVQAKYYNLVSKGGQPAGEEPQRELPGEEVLKKSGYEASLLYKAFSGEEIPSDMINRLMKSKKEKDRKFGKELISFFGNIRSSLNDFREGKVQAKVFLIGDTVLSVHQNAFGQLTLNAGGKELALNRHTGILSDMLAQDIVKNEKLYGKKEAQRAVRDALKRSENAGLGNECRQVFVNYLTQNTGYKLPDLSNFLTLDLAHMARSILAGKKVYILDQKELDGWEVEFSDKDVVYSKESRSMINIMDVKELLRETEEKQKEVKEKVVIEKQQQKEKKEPEAKAEEKKEEEKEAEEKQPAWDEKEQKVINLLGDVVFSYETWTADEKKREPGKRMQLMLAKNADALAYLISDMFSMGELNMKMVNGMLDKMPLFIMAPEEAEEFRKVVIKSLQDTAQTIKQAVDGKIQEVLGDAPEGIFESIAYNAKKLGMTAAATAHLLSADSLLKGIEIPGSDIKIDGLKDIILNLTQDQIMQLDSAEKAIDQGVKDTTDKLQQTVTQYTGELFKPENKREEPLADPYQPGLSPEEVKKRKKLRLEQGNERLGKLVKESITSGESGQGLFIKTVFENYFSGVDVMDQRSMLASMIRNAKPVRKLKDVDAEGLDENELKSREAYNDKVKAESMGNYIGGLMKGAGPLFQKMMQGLPTEGLPEELQSAVTDMKSRLAPIPEEIVEAQLFSMVQRSHNQIKEIRMVKPLGAASVGQTFLCRITLADGKVEETAIKLLKPDVTNRMMREKDLMLQCARISDIKSRNKENEKRRANNQPLLPEIGENEKGGMQVTYEGQLERIEEELDLTVEARNVELGKIYDQATTEEEKRVTSMKLNSLVAPTTTSMVLEKAPGETIDNLMDRVNAEIKSLHEVYRRTNLPGMTEEQIRQNNQFIKMKKLYYSNVMQIQDHRKLDENSEEFIKMDPSYVEEKLMKLLGELKQKKSYLDTFIKKWTEDGLFKEGFYHGDPHAGNIMVSDEKLTVIDFGNCTKLKEDQQYHVTRMMAAATTGDMELFRSGLHALLRPEFEQLYQQKRDELGAEIKKIFSLGDFRSAGARIMASLLKAQELGLEVPSSVYNFSQGQMRLQNAIASMNEAIGNAENAIKQCTQTSGDANQIDYSEEERGNLAGSMTGDEETSSYLKDLSNKYQVERIKLFNKSEDIKTFTEEHFDVLKEHFISSVRKDYGKLKDIEQSLGLLLDTKKNLPPEADAGQLYDSAMTTCFKDCEKYIDEGMKARIKEGLLSEGDDRVWMDAVTEELKGKFASVKNALDSFDRLDAIREANTRKNKGEWKPSEREKAQFNEANETFSQAYTPLHVELQENTKEYALMFARLSNPNRISTMKKYVDQIFIRHPEGKEQFMEAYQPFLKAAEEKLNETDPQAFQTIKENLRKAYHELMLQRVTEKSKIIKAAAEGEKTDFLDVMGDVLEEQVTKLLSRMGYRAIGMRRNLEKQKKEASRLDAKE